MCSLLVGRPLAAWEGIDEEIIGEPELTEEFAPSTHPSCSFLCKITDQVKETSFGDFFGMFVFFVVFDFLFLFFVFDFFVFIFCFCFL